MGTWIGHVDEALFFIGLALWWTYNMFKDYIKAQAEGRDHVPKLSYDTTIRGRRIPLEIIIKIGFTSFGILTEMPSKLFTDTPGFIGDDGRFIHMNKLQHITIYAMFLFQAITDLFDWLQWRTIKGLNYLTAVQAFLWYTIAFYYHFEGTDADQLEVILHKLSLYPMQGAAVALLIEYYLEVGVLPQMCRTLFLLTLGTWYIHVPSVLYTVSHPNSGTHNSHWDRDDPMNSHFMISMMGLHLLVNAVVILGIYAGILAWYKRTGKVGHCAGMSLNTLAPNRHGGAGYEKISLLEPEQEDEI